MEIAIGVQFAPRELRFKVESATDDVRKLIEDAFASERKLLWITDSDGREVAIPLDKLAYVELDPKKSGTRVGFAGSSVG